MREIFIDGIEEDKTILVDEDDTDLVEINWKSKAIFLPYGLSFDEFFEVADYVNKRKDKKKWCREMNYE